MPLDNLISLEFTSEQLQKVEQALTALTEVFAPKSVNLTPEQRRQYGSIADRNKVFVDKCKAYIDQDPTTLPPTISKAEFDKDYIAREQLLAPLRRLQRISEMINDTKILLDFDNYNACISYYNYVKFLSSQNSAGSTAIYTDLKAHFKGGKKSIIPDETSNSETKQE